MKNKKSITENMNIYKVNTKSGSVQIAAAHRSINWSHFSLLNKILNLKIFNEISLLNKSHFFLSQSRLYVKVFLYIPIVPMHSQFISSCNIASLS